MSHGRRHKTNVAAITLVRRPIFSLDVAREPVVECHVFVVKMR